MARRTRAATLIDACPLCPSVGSVLVQHACERVYSVRPSYPWVSTHPEPTPCAIERGRCESGHDN